ncbi:hypothetical protein B0H16DRAFT_99969 [Mycena metata]|uniref:MYND-type domain-containing protein n=1 Tax=Mycena metata TaxID=1033252 RepID=A0AAD7IB02_9AGAR|nr:hypothetical protein B0H16DRAFT_99969 [Mycena metata]
MSSPPQKSRRPTLPVLVAVGAACYHCYSKASDSSKLQKCSSCRLVSYCNASCQRKNWRAHKHFCRIAADIESSPLMTFTMAGWIGKTSPDEIESQVNQVFEYFTLRLGRQLLSSENILLHLRPRCLTCGRTDQLIRIECSLNSAIAPHTLIPCPKCHLSFACQDHWSAAYVEHTQIMCEGGYDGLPHCVLNQELLEDDEFSAQMLRRPELHPQYSAPTRAFRWIPPPHKRSWTSLKTVTWADEFQPQLELEFLEAAPSISMRRMSDILCMPMTALYALECLNDNLNWTKKGLLSIHVIGAQSKELWHAVCFENILHQLPAVKLVHVVICGALLEPHLGDDMRSGPYDIQCCQDCERKERGRGNDYYDVHYHDLPAKIGPNYRIPDLAIAFNSGASEASYTAAWKKTVAFLVENNIPSVFTAYTAAEAAQDHQILVDAQAKLVPELGPCRNPWGSLLSKKDFGQQRQFYSDNMYLAGGFKGRS